MRASFLGENGRSQPATTGPVGRYLEEAPRLEAGTPTPPSEPAVAAAQQAGPGPSPAVPARIGAFHRRDPAARRRYERESGLAAAVSAPLRDAVADKAAPAREPAAAPLWESVAAPVEMTAAKAAEAGLDDARETAREEYERRILGAAERPAAGASAQPPAGAAAAPEGGNAGDMFVAIELSVRGETGLRDAVSDFARASGFRPDPRFTAQTQAAYGAADRRVSVRGWLPAARLGEAVQAPGVTRLEIERPGPPPLGEAGAATTVTIGLRLPVQIGAGESFQRIFKELRQSASLRWKKTVGFQSLPGTTDVALVIVGELPVTSLPKLLAHPAVLKIGPALPGAEPAAAAPAPAPSPAQAPATRLSRFFEYVAGNAPLLLVITLLAALIPYSRRR